VAWQILMHYTDRKAVVVVDRRAWAAVEAAACLLSCQMGPI
jgi:hypothetical protein